MPIAITAYKVGNSIIVDPTREEEDLSETRVTIGSSNGIISSIQKGESMSLTKEEMDKVLDMVTPVWKQVNDQIEKALK